MVSLPELASYSESEWAALVEKSPLCEHYRILLSRTPKSFEEELRQSRHSAWLQCAFATLLNNLDPEQVCRFWSDASEKLILKAWKHHGLDKYPIHLLAFGKLGSKELNLSSDIDIVFVADGDEPVPRTAVKNFIHTLSAVTDWGFCYRVDTDLRPGGPSSPLIPTIDSFIHYYGYHGEPWHRLSFIRCRALKTGRKIPKELQSFLSNYSFPRRLDYRIVNSIRGLRSKIHALPDKDLHLKLAPGGIRDIEFFIQSLQLIYGGRIEALRTPSIQTAMLELCQQQKLSNLDFSFFSQFYWHLRGLENAIQCYQDHHTYTISNSLYDQLKLKGSVESLEKELEQSYLRISEHFEEENPEDPGSPHNLAGVAIPDLVRLSDDTQKRVREILYPSSPLRPGPRGVRKQVMDKFLVLAEKNRIDLELAVSTFVDFLIAAKADSSLYHILNNNIQILEQMAWLFSFSPYTGRVLSRRPELIDSFSMGSVEIDPHTNDIEKFLEDLLDYKLLNQLSAISYFLKNQSISILSAQISACADTIAKNIIAFLGKSHRTDNIDILCLGKWGGRELGFRSDLDFIFVTKADPGPEDFQVAKRFINLISYPSRGGTLYQVDLRLKPDATGGPLIVGMQSLTDFLTSKAEVWQFQAYLKGRFLFGRTSLYADIEGAMEPPSGFSESIETVLSSLLTRQKLKSVDVKYNPGGLVHTEFIIQKKIIANKLWAAGSSSKAMLKSLQKYEDENLKSIWLNYTLMRKIIELQSVLTDVSGSTVRQDSQANLKIQRVLGLENVYETLVQTMDEQCHLLKELDANY